MKRFEVVHQIYSDPVFIVADMIEVINSKEVRAIRFDECAEPVTVAWFRDVIYWRELSETQ